MESSKVYARSLASKAPPPDELEALGGEDMAEEADEDAETAQFDSAFNDFASAAGFKSTPEAKAAFKELVSYCK